MQQQLELPTIPPHCHVSSILDTDDLANFKRMIGFQSIQTREKTFQKLFLKCIRDIILLYQRHKIIEHIPQMNLLGDKYNN